MAQDREVKAELARRKLPLKLYEQVRTEQKGSRIVRKDTVVNETEVQLLVELVKQLVAGQPELEAELATMLMKDLEYLSKVRDMNFVNKVFLQLLRTEKTVPVCLWPYDSENRKWLPSYKPVAGV